MCESHVAQWLHAALRAVHCSVALRQQTIFDAHLLLSAGADFCTPGILWRGWAMADGKSSSTAMAAGGAGGGQPAAAAVHPAFLPCV